jgi:hypothetical protein
MSAHGEEGNEGKHTTIVNIITNLEYILKEHCEKIKLIESHLLFIKEQLDEDTSSTVGKVEIVQEETKKEFKQID